MSTFQKFIQYYKPYKKVFIFDLICAAFISLVDLAYPQILRSLTKTLFLKDASMILKTLPIIGGILFICYIFQAFCKYYVSCQGHIMGAQMERDMRRKLFDHYENLSFSYYDQHNTGQMMSRLVSDLFDISEAAHHGPENLFISLVKIVGSFIFLFIIQWKLAIILLAIVLLMIFFSAKQNRKMQATFLDNRRKIGDVNASLQDSLAGIRIVQSFANEDIEREKFRVGNEAFLDSKRDNYRAMGSFQSGNTFFQGMMYLVTLLAGGYFIALGQMSAADLAMYALYIGIFISPIQILVELTEMIQKGMSGFIRYQSVIDIESEITDSVDAVNMKHPDGDICYHDVSFSYEDNEIVLNHIDFTIKSGKSIALVGPSGGGKTTICSLLPRFYDITDGLITIGGQNIKDIKLESLRSSIGIVQQDVYLFGGSVKENIAYGNPVSFSYEDNEIVLNHIDFTIKSGKSIALVGPSGGGKTTICSLLPRFYDITDGLITIGGQNIKDIKLESLRSSIGIVQQDVYLFGGSVKENIAYGNPDATFDEIVEAAKKANIHDFIMTLPNGYDTFVGERGTRLSGGQKQRISIARVFLKNPPILILDEATSALDNESEQHIQKSLDALSENRTTITIAHRLSTIQNADEILVIDGQTIKERGTHEELIASGGLYAKYYHMM